MKLGHMHERDLIAAMAFSLLAGLGLKRSRNRTLRKERETLSSSTCLGGWIKLVKSDCAAPG